MSATARQAQDQPGLAGRLGIKPGQVVQEIGYDDDCDEQLRDEIDGLENVELVDEDYDDVVDVVLLCVPENSTPVVGGCPHTYMCATLHREVHHGNQPGH